MQIEDEVYVSFAVDVACNLCGEELHAVYGVAQIMIDPCEKCMSNATDAGYEKAEADNPCQ